MTAMEALQRAIDQLKGPTAFASAIGVSDSAPHMWKKRGRVPAEYCPAIERATGGAVRCEELRPDVAWDVLREQAAPAEAAAQGG
jgi:DNA-binding transcriptional regulator YdaS (Cro superfamily)